MSRRVLWLGVALAVAAASLVAAAVTFGSSAGSDVITPRQLVQSGALVGEGPEDLAWSPVGARLLYVDAGDSGDVLWLYDAGNGSKREVFDPAKAPDGIDVTSAQWSPDGRRLLLAGQTSLWVLTVRSGALTKVPPAGQGGYDAMSFTPTGTAVCFTRSNDLYLAPLDDGAVRRLTKDGTPSIFNGCLDWVYNEELATRAAQPGYAWSPDGRRLFYLRLDDRKVDRDPTTDYSTVPASVTWTRYPTVGTTNPAASLHFIGAGGRGTQRTIPLPRDAEYVLPFFTWTHDSTEAYFMTVDRDHTVLRLCAYTPSSGRTRTVIKESSKDFVSENYYCAPVFLPDGKRFLWLSERDGFMHLYLYSRTKGLVRQLTQGDWLVDTTPYGILTAGRPVYVDSAGTWAYFNATKQSPLERQIFRVAIKTGELQQLSDEPGFHEPALSGDGRYLVEQFSAADTPPVTSILDPTGGLVVQLAACAGPSLDLPGVQREFVTIEADDGTPLYCQIVKPEGFDPAKKYPVVVHWYGGPGLQLVSNRYGTTNIFNIIERDTLYTQAGYIVWRLDDRGAFGRGHAFEAPIFGELGPAELQDQLAGIDYLKTLSYIDTTRIGTDGKSFGGFMTLYALLHAPDVFKCGVAGSAPTDWSWYDTIYTERYMRAPGVNPDGYAATNLVDIADQLQAAPLIISGTADTNVHLQNSMNFIRVLEHNDKPYVFVPLVGYDHSYKGDGLVTALEASVAYFADEL